MKFEPAILKLPGILSKYQDVGFVEKRRAQFIYYLLLALILSVAFLIITSSYLHTLNPQIEKTFLPVIIPMVILLVILLICLWFLIKGYFKLSAHLLIISSLASTWLVMVFDQNEPLIRLDTIVLIFAILSMLPLMVQSNKYIILIYILTNIILFFVFIFIFKDEFNLTTPELTDYLIDVTLALAFLGFVNYNIFAINQSALYRAATDIAKRQKVEKALTKSEKRYRDMADLLPVTVFESDKDGILTYINKSGIQKLGYPDWDNNTKIEILDHVNDKVKLKDYLQRLKYDHHLSREQLEITTRQNNPFIANIYVNKIVEHDELIGYRGVIIDITEDIDRQKEIERYKNHLEELVNVRTHELNMANQELKQANQKLDRQKQKLEAALSDLKNTHEQLIQTEKMASLGVLTAGVAHEINNPLNFIQGGYTGLKKYFEKVNNQEYEIQVFLNSIKSGIDRSAAIISGLNQFSRQKDTLEEACDLQIIMDNCLLILNNKLKDRAKVKKNYQSESVKITGNAGKLHQVFLNLLKNAIQAIPKEGIISISIANDGKHIKIIIEDSGVGIDKEDLSKVLDPFFTTKDPGEGTGLGLSISNSIIEEHKGKLKINSEKGKGTKVSIIFPINHLNNQK